MYFWLPSDLANDGTTSISISYSVRAHPYIVLGLVVLAAAACTGVLIIERRADRLRFERMSVRVVDFAFVVLWIASLGFCLIAVGYAGTIIWGLASGDALPTATIIRRWPTLAHAWDLALFSSHAMFVLAAAGCVLEWIVSAATAARTRYSCHLKSFSLFWTWAFWPVLLLLLLFLLSGGGWSGRYTPLDMHYMSLGGLVPYSDARVYYAAPFEGIYEGAWNAIAAQRPFAAAARSVVLFLGAYSYTGSLVVQALLVTVAIVFCARSIAKRYGIWITLAFTGLALGLARPFLTTMMTESLGLMWGLLALALFVRCFRLASLHFAFLGYAALCIGLLTRMGSMFTILAVPAWIAMRFGHSNRQRLYLLGVAAIIGIAVLGINFLLAFSFTPNAGDTGGNFSYTICGLSRGTNWAECANTFSAQLAAASGDRVAQNALLWNEALKAIHAQPAVLLGTLYSTMVAYFENIPRFFVVQYTTLFWPPTSVIQTILVMLLPGWLYFFSRRDRLPETTFLLTLLASVVLSSAFVFRDDGGRVLTVTHVFIAMMLALGLSTPMMPSANLPRPVVRWQNAALGLSVIVILLLVVPLGARLLLGAGEKEIAIQNEHSQGNVHLVLPTPALTGFVVQPEQTDLRQDIPSMHVSTLEAIFRQTGIEKDLGPYIADIVERLPVALVYGVRIDAPNSINQYIVSADVLKAAAVRVWKFELVDGAGNGHVHIVRKAIPIR
ncbi:hypothetical protein [Bradyrhizobium sp. LHD-71]|uniref:hypothetical protein n=1 Tax=Bradyrhizobium sp. LHD-71 TaxID=3072141 RepID=UPI00280DA47E|nr:hypothetical protein [Bradyrhizobium sp. LHD-71]MDQ8728339.1 hypothetical protein [Bradyrhizobium sp. LHD-71]